MTVNTDHTDSLISQLATMPERDFRTVVDSDTRGTGARSISAGLRTRRIAPRWYETLMLMQRSVEGQLAAKGSEARAVQAELRLKGENRDALAAQAQAERWRAGALRFKSGLEEKLLEAKALLREYGDPMIADATAEERNRALARVSELEGAIRLHRENFPVDVEDPSTNDEKLWSHVG